MPTEKETRKLAAIMCADVKGYSRLMGENESCTVGMLKKCRELFSGNIEKHGGRVVNAPGDSILAEFPSAVSAVQSAAEIQEQLTALNADLPDNRKMEFRIGINLGDVIQSEDAIYGDGVNIAARIEALSEPGGVSISKDVFNFVRKKLTYGFEYQGEHRVKNIADPINVYKVLLGPADEGKMVGIDPAPTAGKWIWPTVVMAAIFLTLVGYQVYLRVSAPEFEPASIDKMVYPLPEKPSIAVLPFDNISGDPEQEYFCDGITENIITALSMTPKMLVIAWNSTFSYKGESVEIRKIAEDLGVRYVLEGSVQTSGDRVRVAAQLIDALKGHHLWAERYDNALKDIFKLQDDITKKIISSLQVELTEGEQALLAAEGTDNMDAFLTYLKAGDRLRQFNKDDNRKARELAQKVIALDPHYSMGYCALAFVEIVDIWLGASKSPKDSVINCIALSKKSIAIRENPQAHRVLALAYVVLKKHGEAIEEAKKAVEMAPSSADNYMVLGHVYMLADIGEEAIAVLNKAIRLNPSPPSPYFHNLAWSYIMIGRFEEAIPEAKKSLAISPNNEIAHRALICAYLSTGHEKEARMHAAEVLRIDPDFSVERAAKTSPIKNKEKLKTFMEQYLKAGLKK